MARPREASKGGLILINSTSFSSTSSVVLDNVFNSTYTSYKVVLNNVIPSAYTEIQTRLRASGSNNTSSNYYSLQTFTQIDGTATGSDKVSAGTYWLFANVDTGGQIDSWYDIWNPFATARTQYSFTHAKKYNTTNYYNMYGGGIFNATTSFDGLNLIASGGTISGSVQVYGYRK